MTDNLPILLAVVGHTNTGKTSLVRTLLRTERFGDIRNSAGTTRHVEAASILCDGKPLLELRDTPGLEDSVALFDQLQPITVKHSHGRDALQAFIAHEAELPDFEQEIKVLKQTLACHALLYVIDCREPVLEKYVFELRALSLAGRPIIPVLNFIADNPVHKKEWRQALINFNLHAVVEFDTVAFSFDAERRLYEKLQTVLEDFYTPLQNFIEARNAQWTQLKHSCAETVADLMMKAAMLRERVPQGEPLQAATERLQQQTRALEQKTLRKILDLLQFSQSDVNYVDLPVSNGQWQLDLFAPEAFKTFGVNTASAAATGAAIGAGLDLLVAGMSLGAASLTGAALGAGWSTVKRYGRELIGKASGEQVLCLDQATLSLLLVRQTRLLQALLRRGHAAQNRFDFSGASSEKNELADTSALIKRAHKMQNPAVQDNESFVTQVKTELVDWQIRAL